jgi:hemerythrin
MAQTLRWSKSFAVGHEGLDSEHRHLVKLINEIGAVVRSKKNPEKLVDLVKVLHRVAVEHIRHENTILWQIQTGSYKPLQKQTQSKRFLRIMAKAAFDEHVAEHDALLARLATIVGGPASKLCDELKAWFVDHLYSYESDLKAIFQSVA